jgi:hypothetical protein
VWCIETVDDNGEGQACRWTGSGKGWMWRLGPRDRGPEDRPWVVGVHQVKTSVDQVKREHEDLMINGQGQVVTHVEIMRKRSGLADTRLHLGLAVSALKPWAVGLSGLGLET